jgi:hypothetical protein
MRDRDLYSKIHGVSAGWHVTHMALDIPAGKVEGLVEHRGEGWPYMPSPPRHEATARRSRPRWTQGPRRCQR